MVHSLTWTRIRHTTTTTLDRHWSWFSGVRGVPEGLAVGIRVAEDADGVWRLAGLCLDFTDERGRARTSQPIPVATLAALPITDLVRAVAPGTHGASAWIGEVPGRPRGGSMEFSGAVASVFRQGAGIKQGEATVAQVFNVSVPTAKRWIREARDHGVLAESKRSGQPRPDRRT